MTSMGLSLFLSCLAALFDVRTLPLPSASPLILLADADSDGTGDVVCVDADKLTIFESGKDYAAIAIPFAKGTTAFDIIDMDADGRNEVIAICGDKVQRYEIPTEGDVAPPRDLFPCQTTLGDASGHPFPQVMAIKRDGRPVLALPCAEAVEIRGFDGALVARYPTRDEVDLSVSWLDALGMFSYGDVRRDAGMEIDVAVTHRTGYVESPPNDLMPASQYPSLRSLNRWVHPEGRTGQTYWWFPLKTDGTTLLRAMCALHWRQAATDVRISEARSEADRVRDTKVPLGPARRYPGNLLCNNYVPDFNRDGYTDLVLWKAPMPGMSVDAMTRAVTGGAWPLEVVIHFFSPEKKRFEPVPAAQLSLTIPITYFLEHNPIQNEVFGDFNGDGRTDIALSNTKNGYAVWLFTENGLSKSPDFERVFPERIAQVQFAEDLDGKGRMSVALRGAKNLYLLHALP